MSTVHRDLRLRHRSQALTLCDLYGRAPALTTGEGSLEPEVLGSAVEGAIMSRHADAQTECNNVVAIETDNANNESQSINCKIHSSGQSMLVQWAVADP